MVLSADAPRSLRRPIMPVSSSLLRDFQSWSASSAFSSLSRSVDAEDVLPIAVRPWEEEIKAAEQKDVVSASPLRHERNKITAWAVPHKIPTECWWKTPCNQSAPSPPHNQVNDGKVKDQDGTFSRLHGNEELLKREGRFLWLGNPLPRAGDQTGRKEAAGELKRKKYQRQQPQTKLAEQRPAQLELNHSMPEIPAGGTGRLSAKRRDYGLKLGEKNLWLARRGNLVTGGVYTSATTPGSLFHGLSARSVEPAQDTRVQSRSGLPMAASFFMCSWRVRFYELGSSKHQALPPMKVGWNLIIPGIEQSPSWAEISFGGAKILVWALPHPGDVVTCCGKHQPLLLFREQGRPGVCSHLGFAGQARGR